MDIDIDIRMDFVEPEQVNETAGQSVLLRELYPFVALMFDVKSEYEQEKQNIDCKELMTIMTYIQQLLSKISKVIHDNDNVIVYTNKIYYPHNEIIAPLSYENDLCMVKPMLDVILNELLQKHTELNEEILLTSHSYDLSNENPISKDNYDHSISVIIKKEMRVNASDKNKKRRKSKR